MKTLEERRESFVENALPYIAGTDYGDGKRVIARTGLGMGFDQGYRFAIERAWKWVEDACSKHPITADELSILKQSFKHTMEE